MKRIVLDEIEIVGDRANPNTAEAALALLVNSRVDLTPLLTHRFPLADFATALDTFETRKDGAVKVAITPARSGLRWRPRDAVAFATGDADAALCHNDPQRCGSSTAITATTWSSSRTTAASAAAASWRSCPTSPRSGRSIPGRRARGCRRCAGASPSGYRLCANYTTHNVCNWAIPADDPRTLCPSCRLTRAIPDPSLPVAARGLVQARGRQAAAGLQPARSCGCRSPTAPTIRSTGWRSSSWPTSRRPAARC